MEKYIEKILEECHEIFLKDPVKFCLRNFITTGYFVCCPLHNIQSAQPLVEYGIVSSKSLE